MKRRALLLGLVLVLISLFALVVLRKPDPGFPVEIPCGQLITHAQVIASINSALILAPDGTVWGWGANDCGWFDSRNMRGRWNTPRRLAVGSNWVSLAAGVGFVVGIKTDGTLWGWSFHPFNGQRSVGDYSNPPTLLAPGPNWIEVTAGMEHALALRSDGMIWAWGLNDYGQVGDGTKEFSVVPTQIGTNENWTAIAASSRGSLGLQADGSLWQWGHVHSGYSKEPDIELTEPTRVGNGTNWIDISAGPSCFAASQIDKSLWIWGPNSHSLGSTNRQQPFCLSAATNWAATAVGTTYMLALHSDGSLFSCGFPRHGETGAKTTPRSDRLTKMGIHHDWVNVWAGDYTSFGLTKDGTLWTWGKRLHEKTKFTESKDRMVGEWLPRRLSSRLLSQDPPKDASDPWPLVHFTTNSHSGSH